MGKREGEGRKRPSDILTSFTHERKRLFIRTIEFRDGRVSAQAPRFFGEDLMLDNASVRQCVLMEPKQGLNRAFFLRIL